MYIKKLEIDNFKSFANKTEIPLLKGFTSITGPNGSGKSNIIDSIMFALGLRQGSALRIENSADYITAFNNRNEAFVKVVFGEVNGNDELSVSRRIKKGSQGYVSTYYLNDKAETLTNIRAVLEEYNVTPNSYNVVMQYDINNIISASSKARRGIIDEIAGVADFDRRIDQAKGELEKVEQRVESASLILSEVASQLEQLKEEREVALKYKKLKDEKSGLEAQIGTVKFFDLKRNLELAHENILKANKTLKEKESNKKDLEERIKLIQNKYKELNDKLQEQGEAERNKLNDKKSEISTQIQTKKNASDYAQTQIQKGLQSIENAKNGIEEFKKNIEKEQLNIKLSHDKLGIIETQLKEKKEELQKKLKDISGLSSTVDKYIQERNEVSKNLDSLKDKDNELLKESLPKENELKVLTKVIADAKEFIENALKDKTEFADKKADKELQVNDLKKEMDELKEVQSSTMKKLDDIKTAIEDYEHDSRVAYRKFTEMEAQKSAGGGGTTLPISTVMNAKLPGVHAPIMQLGTVDDEYSIALNIAFGGRLAHIVVDDTHSANIAMELLTSSRAGRATFIPLNKLRKAPNRLNLPKDKGVIDFAINLVDFDDVYLDAFYYAVGETLIVEDALTAEKLIGRYRMVTLDGKLYEKSSAITGGYIKPSAFGFGKNDDRELENAKKKVDELQKKYNEANLKKNELEEKLTKVRIAYSNASTEYSKSRIELNNMVSQFNNSQGLLEEKQKFITENEPNIKKLNSELDKIEVKRVELADKIQTSQDRLSELDNLLGDKNLAELKEKTQGIEDDIRKLQDDKLAINTEINGYDGKIKFNESLIETKKSDIENSINNNKELELSIKERQTEIGQLEEQLSALSDKIAVIDEKIGVLVKEKEDIRQNLLKLQTDSAVTLKEIESVGEQIESFKARRRELEPQLEDARKILVDGGIEIDKLEPVKISVDELNSKIQRLDKKMQDLGDVNMRAITSYEEKSKRKEELDNQIETLSTERVSILEKMNGFEKQKREAFMTAYNAINTNFTDIYHQLSEGEGKLILENEKDPLSGGMTIEAKPRDKVTNNKLSALSGGEKALTALALVLSIQKYLPAPFYALDEVDASLDAMNVERIAEMIKKQSNDTQFLVVTHKPQMVAEAHRVIGVTQKEKGKTKVTGIQNNE
ncbi:MAG: chromosome segregation protein SMC [Cyanobacteriota bacterium]|nr:chromosome segregation protein SMC [Cyanobacteriota bacterium]MDY6382467.1 chromosome segregation protein SMC [Cyanobacteriota bacterium]